MGVFSDLLVTNQSIDVDLPIEGVDRVHVRELQAWKDKVDPALGTAFAERDEAQSLAVYEGTVSGGDFTLEFTLWSGETFTTAAIAFDANAATIEGAIDTAATAASVAGWTNGDIAVTGGDLNTNPVVFTFDGASVAGQNHATIVVDDAGLTGGGTAGAVTTTADGQSDRKVLAALYAMGAISGTVPGQGDAPSDWVAGNVNLPGFPSRSLIKELAREAAIEERQDAVYTTIVGLFNY